VFSTRLNQITATYASKLYNVYLPLFAFLLSIFCPKDTVCNRIAKIRTALNILMSLFFAHLLSIEVSANIYNLLKLKLFFYTEHNSFPWPLQHTCETNFEFQHPPRFGSHPSIRTGMGMRGKVLRSPIFCHRGKKGKCKKSQKEKAFKILNRYLERSKWIFWSKREEGSKRKQIIRFKLSINIYKTLTSLPSRRAWQERKGGRGERQKTAKKGGGLAAPERASCKIKIQDKVVIMLRINSQPEGSPTQI